MSDKAFQAQRYWQQVLPGELRKVSRTANCCYCGKKIRMEEAVVRDDIIMCKECAVSHPPTANTKKGKTR